MWVISLTLSFHNASEMGLDELLRCDRPGCVPGPSKRPKMAIRGNDVLGLSGDCAVNELVVIRVGRDDPKPEMWIHEKNVGVETEQQRENHSTCCQRAA